MKKIIALFLLLLIGLTIFTFVDAVVRVKGYFRKDGTYVQPHYRSNPDSNPYNNWSYPGNVNPYTGKVAPGNPDTYLKNYSNPPLITIPISSPSISSQIITEINRVKFEYYRNPHWFRENLISKLKSSLDINFFTTDYNNLTFYVYSMLLDVK